MVAISEIGRGEQDDDSALSTRWFIVQGKAILVHFFRRESEFTLPTPKNSHTHKECVQGQGGKGGDERCEMLGVESHVWLLLFLLFAAVRVVGVGKCRVVGIGCQRNDTGVVTIREGQSFFSIFVVMNEVFP